MMPVHFGVVALGLKVMDHEGQFLSPCDITSFTAINYNFGIHLPIDPLVCLVWGRDHDFQDHKGKILFPCNISRSTATINLKLGI